MNKAISAFTFYINAHVKTISIKNVPTLFNFITLYWLFYTYSSIFYIRLHNTKMNERNIIYLNFDILFVSFFIYLRIIS